MEVRVSSMHWLLYPVVVFDCEGFFDAGPGLDALQ
jgi:hypothetical protein